MPENDLGFRFGIDEERPDALLEAESQDQRFDRLNRRISLVYILIPCFILALLYVAYLDIKDRLTDIRSTETVKAETFLKSLEARVSNVSVKLADIEYAVGRKMQAVEKETSEALHEIEKSAQSVSAGIKTANQRIDDLERSKMDKEAVASELARIRTTVIAPVLEEQKKTRENLHTVQEALEKDLSRISGGLDTLGIEVRDLKNRMAALSSEKLDSKAISALLQSEQAANNRKLEQYEARIAQRIRQLQEQADRVERRVSAIEFAASRAASALPSPTAAPSPAPGAGNRPGGAPSPQPGAIIEQDIRQ